MDRRKGKSRGGWHPLARCEPIGVAMLLMILIGIGLLLFGAVAVFTHDTGEEAEQFNAAVRQWDSMALPMWRDLSFRVCGDGGECANFTAVENTEGVSPIEQLESYDALYYQTTPGENVLKPRNFDCGGKNSSLKLSLEQGGRPFLSSPRSIPAFVFEEVPYDRVQDSCDDEYGLWWRAKGLCYIISVVDRICITINRTIDGRWQAAAVAGSTTPGVSPIAGCTPPSGLQGVRGCGALTDKGGSWPMGMYTQVNGTELRLAEPGNDITQTPTLSRSRTMAVSPTRTRSATPSATPSRTHSRSATATATATDTSPVTVTATRQATATRTATVTATTTETREGTSTVTEAATRTATEEATSTVTERVTPTATEEATPTATEEATPTVTLERTVTATRTGTGTSVATLTPTVSWNRTDAAGRAAAAFGADGWMPNDAATPSPPTPTPVSPGTKLPISRWTKDFSNVSVVLRFVYDPKLVAERLTNGTMDMNVFNSGTYYFNGNLRGYPGWAMLVVGFVLSGVPVTAVLCIAAFCPRVRHKYLYRSSHPDRVRVHAAARAEASPMSSEAPSPVPSRSDTAGSETVQLVDPGMRTMAGSEQAIPDTFTSGLRALSVDTASLQFEATRSAGTLGIPHQLLVGQTRVDPF
eukprot:TRINITY_DN5089_c0_g1_i1.p1 TRINITY_DN5089_c0_g1~~TRINITY_DN5089_c0_g1_i1.p1  ORF type:complete len:643 (+),score=192.55 TRINITY_DN5089_c0_g1_i1:177-2105(+)